MSRVWDKFARKYRTLSEEEWVRQHLVHYLVDHLGYPSQLISTEHPAVKIGQYWHRADVVVHRLPQGVWLLAECKAPNVLIDASTLTQLMKYNKTKAALLLLSNGITHYSFQWNNAEKQYICLSSLPTFHELQKAQST